MKCCCDRLGVMMLVIICGCVMVFSMVFGVCLKLSMLQLLVLYSMVFFRVIIYGLCVVSVMYGVIVLLVQKLMKLFCIVLICVCLFCVSSGFRLVCICVNFLVVVFIVVISCGWLVDRVVRVVLFSLVVRWVLGWVCRGVRCLMKFIVDFLK